jgi:hypothetical protein
VIAEDVEFELTTTVNDSTPIEVSKDLIIQTVANIFNYLVAITTPGFTYSYIEVTTDDDQGSPYATAVFLTPTGVSTDDFITINLGLDDPFDITTGWDPQYKVVVPYQALPPVQQIMVQVSNINSLAIYELNATFTFKRQYDLVDANFQDVLGVAVKSSVLQPLNEKVKLAEEHYGPNYEDDLNQTLSLNQFAVLFETTYNQGQEKYKIATGMSLNDAVKSGGSQTIWVVHLGPIDGISYEIGGQASFFSPTPLAVNLLSFSGAAAIPIRLYADGAFGEPTLIDFIGIDMDGWGQQFLTAIDQFFLPQCAVPAYIVDSRLFADPNVEGYVAQLLAAKKVLANALVQYNVDPLEARFTTILSDENFSESDLKAAQSSLQQQLLIRLMSVYETDAVVQFRTAVQSPYPNTDVPIAPNLSGQPKAPETTDNISDQQYSISTAKVPLTNGDSHLSFLFDAKHESNQSSFSLQMEYQVNQLEHEITPITVDGEAGSEEVYTASSWLHFVVPLPPDPILVDALNSPVEIPIPLRTYPTPPSLLSQLALVAHEEGTMPELQRFQHVLEWNYVFTYEVNESSQDELELDVQFNLSPDQIAVGSRDFRDVPDHEKLFAALAEFTSNSSSLQSDLIEYVLPITPASDQAAVDKAEKTINAFNELVQAVANSWSGWAQPTKSLDANDTGFSTHKYQVTEEDVNDDLVVIITKINTTEADTNLPLPIMEIAGYQTISVVTDNTIRCSFVTNDTAQEPLLYTARKDYPTRSIEFKELNIFQYQNAWSGVILIRNENLGFDIPTSRAFIYQTPIVRFSNNLVPVLTNNEEINIAALTTNGDTEQRTLSEILSIFFQDLFEGVASGSIQKINLAVGYEYSLRADENGDVIHLPILFIPPYDFDVPVDWDANSQDTFVSRLSLALTTWKSNYDPSEQNARFVFDLAIYSNLNDSIQPILRLTRLFLDISNITPPSAIIPIVDDRGSQTATS